MKIVFFSSNSNIFNEQTYLIKTMPCWQSLWDSFINAHKEHEFICISQKPALFMPENTIICEKDDTKEFALEIALQKPDVAIALSFWTDLFDWLPVKDALIAQELEKMNVKVLCNTVAASLLCFNKTETQKFFDQNHIPQPSSIFVNHDLYFCGGNRKEIKYNVYKEAIISEISKLHFPLIIKDPVSLSSYGMQVVNTKGEAANYLNSKKHSSDRLVQEFIDGINLGVELYGYYENLEEKSGYKCNIMPPFTFSVNQYGITSPKQSVKYGPVILNDKMQEKLVSLVKGIADKLKLVGPAQIDLIYKDNTFYIIEINPRLSGMTSTCCSSLGINFYEMIYAQLIEHKSFDFKDFSPVLNCKLPLLNYEQLEKLKELSFIKFINQINNLEAKQEREKGYCEIVICGKNDEILKENLQFLLKNYPECVEVEFIEKAAELIEKFEDFIG